MTIAHGDRSRTTYGVFGELGRARPARRPRPGARVGWWTAPTTSTGVRASTARTSTRCCCCAAGCRTWHPDLTPCSLSDAVRRTAGRHHSVGAGPAVPRRGDPATPRRRRPRGRQRPDTAPRGARRRKANREGAPHHVCRQHARPARGRRPLRSPDPPLEPEDEALHLRRAQRHLHHRHPADHRRCSRPPTTSCATPSPRAGRSCSSAPRSRPRRRSRPQATRVGMPYVNYRWLGGMLTNFETIQTRLVAPARARGHGQRRHHGAAAQEGGPCSWGASARSWSATSAASAA